MKYVTKVQMEIINYHLTIEGSENFDSFPLGNGIKVKNVQ
jgi:hypothetical protein